jgi:hypothetical protein
MFTRHCSSGYSVEWRNEGIIRSTVGYAWGSRSRYVWESGRLGWLLNIWSLTGILRNISPIPPLSLASTIDIDKDVVLPLLQPVVTSISLPDVSDTIQQLLAQKVIVLTADCPRDLLTHFHRVLSPRSKGYP